MRKILPVSALILLAACGDTEEVQPVDETAAVPVVTSEVPPTATVDPAVVAPAAGVAPTAGAATAEMRDPQGRSLGTLTLADAAGGISVSGTLRGLEPGQHGFHVHTTGECEPTFAAAGGHWNPTNAQHGTLAQGGPHFGDMENISVGTDSTVTIQATTPGGSLRGTNAALDADGAAVMVHAQPDDYNSQPAGDAGDRVACGVIQAA